jgi:hypothetical protein
VKRAVPRSSRVERVGERARFAIFVTHSLYKTRLRSSVRRHRIALKRLPWFQLRHFFSLDAIRLSINSRYFNKILFSLKIRNIKFAFNFYSNRQRLHYSARRFFTSRLDTGTVVA